jgi:DNA repair protein RadC
MAKNDSNRPPRGRNRAEDRAIARALEILERRLRAPVEPYRIDSPGAAHAWARLKLGALDREAFAVIFLDARHHAIALEELFRGTLKQTPVYPREIVRAAMRHNAAAVLLVHNHPSGHAEFSRADEELTQTIREALRLVDVDVLDHLLVAGNSLASLATIEQRREADKEQAQRRLQDALLAKRSLALKAAWQRRRERTAAGDAQPHVDNDAPRP